MSFLFNYSGANLLIMLCVRLIIVFLILPIHEFAHGYAARKLGDNTAVYMGRLTLNPLSHVEPIGAVLLILTGFGWAKPVPVNPRNFKNYNRDMALTAFAGPLSNLICALAGTFVVRVMMNIFYRITFASSAAVTVFSIIVFAAEAFVTINLSLAIFNLMPIEPLDGSRILNYFLPQKAKLFLAQNAQIIRIVFLVVIFGGLLSGPLSWLINRVYDLFYLLFFWVDIIFKLF